MIKSLITSIVLGTIGGITLACVLYTFVSLVPPPTANAASEPNSPISLSTTPYGWVQTTPPQGFNSYTCFVYWTGRPENTLYGGPICLLKDNECSSSY